MNLNENFRWLHAGLPEDIRRLKEIGNFEEASKLIKLRRSSAPYAMKHCLDAEAEIMRRIPREFPYSRQDALSLVRSHIADFTDEEFDSLVTRRRIRWAYIDGQKHFVRRFYETLCRTEPGFARRAGVPEEDTLGAESPQDRALRIIEEKGHMDVKFIVHTSIRLKDEFFTPGAVLDALLPLPRTCPVQSEISLLKYSSDGFSSADSENELNRTIRWHAVFQKNTTFSVEYTYVRTGLSTAWSTAHNRVLQTPPKTCDTSELPPHIIFNPYIRSLAEEISTGCSTPYEKARAFYDYITLNVKYTYMPAYVCLEDIALECARSLTGDCGVMALLFIALCRCSGIPAAWESGLVTRPNYCGCHDWARFYCEPYGWLYADPSFGTGAVRSGDDKKRNFYFGNIDPWRMAANCAFQHSLHDWDGYRSDPYDSQIGEMMLNGIGCTPDMVITEKKVISSEELS